MSNPGYAPMQREYSKRLGVIDDDQLQTALDRFGLGRLLSAEPAAGGLFGQNILLESTEGSFVFRGAPHWNPAGEDDWQFPKERYFARLLADSASGAPVPWPYLVDETRGIFGWGYAIMPRLSGLPLLTPAVRPFSDADHDAHATAMALGLAAVHAVTLPAAGLYHLESDGIRAHDERYGSYVANTVRTLLEACLHASAATTRADVTWVEAVIERALPAFDEPFTPSVVHHDFHDGNVLVDDSSGAWRLSGIIDWMTAEAGDPEADLARYLSHHAQHGPATGATFLATYQALRPPRAGFAQRFPVFMLWERLLIWEYGQRSGWFPDGLTLRTWAEPFTQMLGRL